VETFPPQTIHKWLTIETHAPDFSAVPSWQQRIDGATRKGKSITILFIVDEVSMLLSSTWHHLLDMATKRFGCNSRVLMRWCLCGDIHQLPVVGGTSVFDLNSFRTFLRTANVRFLALTEIERCKYKDGATGEILVDEAQVAVLDELYRPDPNPDRIYRALRPAARPKIGLGTYSAACPTNALCDKHNIQYFRNAGDRDRVEVVVLNVESRTVTIAARFIRSGIVLGTKNNSKSKIVNGKEYTVADFSGTSTAIPAGFQLVGTHVPGVEMIALDPSTLITVTSSSAVHACKPFLAADKTTLVLGITGCGVTESARTIHKLQGNTVKGNLLIRTSAQMSLAHLVVAVSRVTRFSHLRFKSEELSPDVIRTIVANRPRRRDQWFRRFFNRRQRHLTKK
jgi:hypothetical protein